MMFPGENEFESLIFLGSSLFTSLYYLYPFVSCPFHAFVLRYISYGYMLGSEGKSDTKVPSLKELTMDVGVTALSAVIKYLIRSNSAPGIESLFCLTVKRNTVLPVRKSLP